VLGYGCAQGLDDDANLESTFIVVEAKKKSTLLKAEAQAAAYLGMLRMGLVIIALTL